MTMAGSSDSERRRPGAPGATLPVIVAALLPVALGLASCGTGPADRLSATRTSSTTTAPPAATPATVSTLAGAVVRGRFVRPVHVGGLEVEPDDARRASAPLGLSLATATSYTRFTGGLGSPELVGFGRVTLRGVTPPPGTPSLDATPAWVAIAPQSSPLCPVMRPPPPGAPTTTSPYRHGIFRVAVFFGSVARGGRGAVIYQSGGNFCGASEGPRVQSAVAVVPVAWELTGPVGLHTTVRYQAPTCATSVGTSSGGNVLTGIFTANVQVKVPFDRAGCADIRSFTQVLTLSMQAPGTPPPPSQITLRHAALPSIPHELIGPLAGAGG